MNGFNFVAFLFKRAMAEVSDLRLLCVGDRQVAIVKFYGTRREKGNISVLSFALCLPCLTFYVTYPSDKFSCNAFPRLLLCALSSCRHHKNCLSRAIFNYSFSRSWRRQKFKSNISGSGGYINSESIYLDFWISSHCQPLCRFSHL